VDQDLRKETNLCLENKWEKYEAYNEILKLHSEEKQLSKAKATMKACSLLKFL